MAFISAVKLQRECLWCLSLSLGITYFEGHAVPYLTLTSDDEGSCLCYSTYREEHYLQRDEKQEGLNRAPQVCEDCEVRKHKSL